MISHDPKPIYDMNLVLQLLHASLENEGSAFWAKVLHEHQISVSLTSVGAFRTGLIKHIFSGGCVAHHGSGCKVVVRGEEWQQSMGIRVIDITLEWAKQGVLTVKELGYICGALDETSSARNKSRSLTSRLTEVRRRLLSTMDAAALSLPELLPCLGNASSAKVVDSIVHAHDVDVADTDAKEDKSAKVLNHITEGKCADSVSKSPGCKRVTTDAHLSHMDAIHLQVNILRRIIDIGSRKQLRMILDLHEVHYEDADKIKRLRARLRKHIENIERGKLKEMEAESERIETLRKLTDIRKNWPNLIPSRTKEMIIKSFRAATSSAALASFTCACCARESPIGDRIRKRHTEVDLDLLDCPTLHWNDGGFLPPPVPFDSGPLRNKLVDARGVLMQNGEVVLELCTTCSRGLHRKSLPKHALANRLYVGPVPDELGDLTMVEESMIARARAKSWIVKLQEQDTDSTSPTAQRALKGHTIIHPQQPDKLKDVLPPPVDETLSFICVIFVGSSKPTKEWLRDKAKPLVVRREKIRSALIWLKQNNPLYKDVEIDEGILETLPVEDVLAYHVEHVESNEAQEVLVSRYDNGGIHADSSSSTNFESVVIADVDAHTPLKQLRAAAVRHVKTKAKPFIQLGHGPKPVNEFFNVDLFPMLYPTLFPYGCGGFEDCKRVKRISLKEHVKYLFSLSDKRFQTHYSFLFTAFNILQRRSLLLGSSLKVKKASFARFAKGFCSVSSEAVEQVLERIEKGEGITAHTDEERRALRLMKEVNLVTGKVPGSSAARVAMRNEIRALTMTHGMPSFYVTINPADTHNPIVKFLAGSDIDVDKMLDNDVPKYWEQSRLISSNPAVGAKFFNTYLKAFIRTVLGYENDDVNVDGGVLGVVKAHYGCVEAQGRGSLHCHMLIWIEGALNPNEIREKVLKNPEWGRTLLDYLDDTITNVVPEDPIPDVSPWWDEKDPCTLRGVDLELDNIEERLSLRMKDINRLAERVQRHRHSHTCYKHYKAGEERTCRFDLKEENFRADSCIDPITGDICLRCLDGLVNNFNMTILEAVRCNMDIQFIGSGESAKAMIFYITDYITKSQLKSHVAYAALQLAVKKCEDMDDADDDFTVRSKRLLQKCAYAMISHQEMSAQQVASYLMGYEDHFTSHSFSCLYWASFERFIERLDEEKLCPINRDQGLNDGGVEEPVPAGEEEGRGDENGSSTEDENDDAEIDDGEDEVAIRVEDDGSVAVLADQVCDYTLRPKEMADMCLWEFVATTEKSYTRPSRRDGGMDEEEDFEIGETPEDVEGLDEQSDEHGEQRGRGSVRKFEFLGEHKERERKHVRLRRRRVVPVPIGPAMPRRDQTDAYLRYCRLMLILFKPWRDLSDLRGNYESWEANLGDFSLLMDEAHKQIMRNMQVLHECRDSRNDHMQTRMRTRYSNARRYADGDAAPGNDIEEIDMSDVLEHLDEIDRMSSRKIDAAEREAQECLDRLEGAGFFTTSLSPTIADSHDARKPELTRDVDNVLEDEWKDTYEKRKAAWKLETRQAEVDEETGPTMTINQIADESEMLVDNVPAIGDASMAGDTDDAAVGSETLIRRVVGTWSLNLEQMRAFEIVARHALESKPAQLLMYLGGPGGTGKSRVVSALRDMFESRGEKRRFRLAAYTGVAARNIGGATLHALLQMNESGREISAKTKRDLSAMWEGVDYLFVDEVSMIGCEMMHKISRALTEAKGSTTAFGGINVIFAGDFAQLPPIGDTRLYKDINTTSLSASATNRAQGKVLGRLLWLSVETVVILHESMRQAGVGNTDFVDLLGRLRDGVCNEDDYELLSGRKLNETTIPGGDGRWGFSPVIVTNNATRDAINCRAAEAFAEQTGSELHWYHAIDTHRKAVVTDVALIEKLEGQHSGQTKHRLRRVPLAIGMPVAINQNFDVAAGVVNGSYGTLRRIRYFTDREGQRHLKSCIVEIPDSDAVGMPHLPAHHFPVLPDSTELRFEHGASHKRCTITRKQVPIEPGFAMTVHKAQGQTMGRVIVDLAGCTGTEPPYVMVSRATSLDGLLVLRDFDARQISKRRSEDLRKEFNRIMILKWETTVKYGKGDEVKEAERKVKELKFKNAAKGTKRKLGDEDGCGGGSKKSKMA